MSIPLTVLHILIGIPIGISFHLINYEYKKSKLTGAKYEQVLLDSDPE